MSVFCNKNKEKLRKIKRFYGVLVRVGRLELPASCSQSKRATNCATPGYEIFQLWSNMWSTPIFDQLPARGKVLSAQLSQGFPGFPRAAARTWASRSQSKRATNCATPGYGICFICGLSCGLGRFLTSGFAEMVPASGSVPAGCGVGHFPSWMGPVCSQMRYTRLWNYFTCPQRKS